MLVIGHRGAKGLAPENTLSSIKAGLDAGVDAIEVDVRVTKDDIPVLNHDDFIKHSEKKYRIRTNNFKQLKELKPNLTTLDEALRHLKGKTLTIVEIKPGENLGPIFDCLRNRLNNEWKSGNLRVASFDFGILKATKAELTGVELVVNEKWSGVRAGNRCRKLGTDYMCMNHKWLWSGFIASVNRSGKKLSTYTLNNPDKAKKWAKHGLFGVVTDYPDRF